MWHWDHVIEESKMIKYSITLSAVFGIAVLMAMTGRGGGNFYVPALIAAGSPMHQAATTAQLILFCTAGAALFVFQKSKNIDWKLAMMIDPPTDVMAIVGGYFAHEFQGSMLKLVFAALLVLAGFFMMHPAKEIRLSPIKRFGFWPRNFGEHKYVVNLWLALPITACTGFVSGMVGISGGSFKIPLMVLACGVPMRVAVATSSAMVAATALMGFVGHTAGGDLNIQHAVPFAITAIIGGFLGGKFSLKTKPKNLKAIFAYTTLIAAVFMVANVLLGFY